MRGPRLFSLLAACRLSRVVHSRQWRSHPIEVLDRLRDVQAPVGYEQAVLSVLRAYHSGVRLRENRGSREAGISLRVGLVQLLI